MGNRAHGFSFRDSWSRCKRLQTQGDPAVRQGGLASRKGRLLRSGARLAEAGVSDYINDMTNAYIFLINQKAHLISGEIYNVGSDEQIMISDLANIIASFFQPKPKIKIDHKKINSSNNIYVPDINKAKNELKLKLYTTLNDSIYNTILYNKNFNLQI